MIFLNPAILFGLLAAAIPVLIHLLNLRKLKQIEFSTLSFLKELQKNKIRKLKLKQWLLLALRVILILFLVIAFARPALKGVAIGGTTSAAKTSAVFILDDTFSMSVITPEGSYFNQAKEIVKSIAENLQEGDEISLITVSSTGKDEILTSGNRTDFLARINNLQISQASGTLDKAIIKAAEVLGESRNFNKEIYILTDYQKGRITENESASDLSELLNENVKIYSFNFPDKNILNVSVDSLQLITSIFEKDKPVSFNITLTNNSNQNVSNAVVSLFINGERSAQKSVSLDDAESQTITIESPVNKTGFIDASVEIEDDDINQDNTRYITFSIPDVIPTAVFASDIKDLTFIETALTAYGSEKLQIRKMNLSQLSSVNPDIFSVIIICGQGQINGIERLKSYLENGGGIIVMPGSGSTFESFNELLNSLDLSPAQGASGNLNKNDNPLNFQTINYEHPVFRDIFKEGQKKQIESPDIYYSLKLKSGTSGTPVISLNNGTTFLSELRKGNGKLLLFSVAPVLSWSNLPLKSIFPPLVNRSVYYLSSQTLSENSKITGSAYNVYLGKGVQNRILVKKPDNSEEYITVSENSNGYIELNDTRTAGIYKFSEDSKIIQQIAVNTDPKESIAEQLDDNAVKEYLEKVNFKGTFFSIPANETPSEVIMQARFGSELWKHFLFAALFIALIEMAVARNAKKDITGNELN